MSSLEIRLSGTGGQGLQMAAQILADAFVRDGRQVARSQSYEPTSRGGLSRSDLVVADDRPVYPLATGIDLLLVLAPQAAPVSAHLVRHSGLVLVDEDLVTEPPRCGARVLGQPLTRTARELGSHRITNVVSLGALAGLWPLCSFEALEAAVESFTPPRFHDLNLRALRAGRALVDSVPV
ncbi:MAG: pyruvate ferredoxin oxidoreductase [Actinomycetia bacterium]|nr:pyruvate ferredoxin oxidoreductase [Actinomycetes bacterium]